MQYAIDTLLIEKMKLMAVIRSMQQQAPINLTKEISDLEFNIKQIDTVLGLIYDSYKNKN